MFDSALKGDSFLSVATALCCSFVRVSHPFLGDTTSAIFVSSGRSSKCWVLNFPSLPCWQFLHPLNRLLISRVKTEKGGGWGRERTSDDIIIVQKSGHTVWFPGFLASFLRRCEAQMRLRPCFLGNMQYSLRRSPCFRTISFLNHSQSHLSKHQFAHRCLPSDFSGVAAASYLKQSKMCTPSYSPICPFTSGKVPPSASKSLVPPP